MNKQEKIQSIRDIIENYGGFDVNDTDHECPVISAVENQKVLIERVNNTDVDCLEYVDEIVVDYFNFSFEELAEELLDEIFEIASYFGFSQEKLFNSCENENY